MEEISLGLTLTLSRFLPLLYLCPRVNKEETEAQRRHKTEDRGKEQVLPAQIQSQSHSNQKTQPLPSLRAPIQEQLGRETLNYQLLPFLNISCNGLIC